MRRVAVLGATGSIGQSTLDVIERHPDRYQATVLSAHRSVEQMAALCRQHRPGHAVMTDPDAAAQLSDALADLPSVNVLSDAAALDDLVAQSDVDTVVAGIVGFAGLRPTLSAARAGKVILLANKEALVSAGGLFMEAVKQGGATLLPVDSEHNAMHQCLPVDSTGLPDMANVEKIILTASGGPFRGRSRESLQFVTPEEACASELVNGSKDFGRLGDSSQQRAGAGGGLLVIQSNTRADRDCGASAKPRAFHDSLLRWLCPCSAGAARHAHADRLLSGLAGTC